MTWRFGWLALCALGAVSCTQSSHDPGRNDADPGVDVDHSAHFADLGLDDARGDGEAAADAGPDRSRDLEVALRGWSTSPRRLHAFVLTDGSGRARSRALVQGTLADDLLHLPGALPDGPSTLWWWEDVNEDAALDADDRVGLVPVAAPRGPSRVQLSPSDARGPAPEPRGDPGSVSGRFEEFAVHEGVYLSFTLTAEGDPYPVASYRYYALPAEGRFTFTLRNVLARGRRYTAAWYIDLNDNRVYDPRGDHGASVTFEGRDTSVLIVHQHGVNRSWTE